MRSCSVFFQSFLLASQRPLSSPAACEQVGTEEKQEEQKTQADMKLNSTPFSEAFVEMVTSWGAVYVALFLPAVLMLANFVFGSCFLSEAIGASQHTEASLHTRYRVMGRGVIALVLALLTWEYYVYFFAFRSAATPGQAAACNPLFVLWDIADRLPTNFSGFRPFVYLFSCTGSDAVFVTVFFGFMLAYLNTVLSVPQVVVRGSSELGVKQGKEISYCRKCAAHVEGMCHHCYLIGNCVGERNKESFLVCLFLGVANLAFLLYRCGKWAFWQSSAAIHLGLVLVVVALFFFTALLLLQLFLRARGLTTLKVWKHAKRTGESFWWVLLVCPMKEGMLVSRARVPGENSFTFADGAG